MSVAAHDDLPQVAVVAGKLDHGLVDLGILVFAFGMRDMDLFPGPDRVERLDQVLAAAAQRDELYPESVYLGQIGIGGELRVED